MDDVEFNHWRNLRRIMDDSSTISRPRLEQLFFNRARLHPDEPAIIFKSRTTSYAELDEMVSRFSADLRSQGVGPGVICALSLGRSPYLVAAVLAVLQTGAAYLPLDARSPAQRRALVLADSGASVLLVDETSPPAPGFAGRVLRVHGGRVQLIETGSLPAANTPAGLAYVIYTSGSTGAPKGVMLGHDATHLIEWARRAYSSDALARVAATTSLCFDPSVFEIFAPLCTGGAVVLKESVLEPFEAGERPTMLGSVPSALTELCRAGAIPESVVALNVGGEVFTGELARRIFALRPNLVLYNHYGPTEATTCATVAKVPRDLVGEPSIGRPVRGARVLLIDGEGKAVEEGQVGEILIGGLGLALGYLNRPDLTAARFVERAEGRYYRSGDLAVWRDGDLHFAGRADRQVKVRGFRIEPAEIEAALLRIAGIDGAIVMARQLAGRSELVGFVQSPSLLSTAEIRGRLAEQLPDYMVPARLVVMRAFPRQVSGKVDVAALPEPVDAPTVDSDDVGRIERPILHVFEEVLGRTGIGPEESFFDLGGDSLASVHAAFRLEELLGYQLPAALIHQAPSARLLAASIEHGRVGLEGHLSLLQSGGPQTPLFCVADLFGQVFNYLSLARQLKPDRSVYGLAPGPLQAAFTVDGDIGRLTEAFMAEVVALQPNGPYLIAGHSAGGVLAQDLACALEATGAFVQLVLLDAYLYSQRPKARAVAVFAARQAAGLFRRPAPTHPGKPRLSLAKLTAQLLPGAATPDWLPRSQIAFASRMMKLGATHRPRRFGGDVLIVKAKDREPIDDLFDTDGRLGWSRALAGQVSTRWSSGTHYTFMREPLVDQSAGCIRSFARS